MDLNDFLRGRRSVRRFKPDAIPDSTIERILCTATSAPSAHNRQPWRFCVLTTPERKARLADALAADFRRDLQRDGLPENQVEARVATSRSRINTSPLVIVMCMDMSDMDRYPDARRQEAERVMAIQSTAAAGLELLLAARAEGLAGVWTCSPLFAPDAVRQALELEPAWEPQAMFFVGQPAQEPKVKESRDLESMVRWF